MRISSKGQSAVEYALLLIIVMGAFVATSFYIKRGIQGRWKGAVDGMGEQYDPTVMSTNIYQTLVSNSYTLITTEEDVGGYWTNRFDMSNSVEIKTGSTSVGGY